MSRFNSTNAPDLSSAQIEALNAAFAAWCLGAFDLQGSLGDRLSPAAISRVEVDLLARYTGSDDQVDTSAYSVGGHSGSDGGAMGALDGADVGRWLDFLGSVARTDKSSIGHGYLEGYAPFLNPFQDRPITLIEIGVQDGFSLNLWNRYFPRATIVGIDNSQECSRFEKDRIKIRLGSQNDEAFLKTVIDEFQPDIVIDDGSHQAHDIVVSLRTLFPALNPGGLYIVEDLNFHRPDRASFNVGAANLGNPIAVGERLVRLLLGGSPFDPPVDEILSSAIDDLLFVTSLPKALLIGKKPAEEISPKLSQAIRAEALLTNTVQGWLGLATFLARHGGKIPDVVHAFRVAVSLNGADANAYNEFSRYLMFQSKIEQAYVVAKRGSERFPDASLLLRQLGELDLLRNDEAAAEVHLKQAIGGAPNDSWAHFHLSEAYTRQNRSYEALQEMQQAIQSARDDIPGVFVERLKIPS